MTAFVVVVASLFLSLQVPKGSIEGRVLNSLTNKPIAGAHVEAMRLASSAPGIDRGTATADANGHFVFQDLPPGTYLLRASANGYASQELHAVSRDTVFHLAPAGTVSGQITGLRGEPLVNMEVTLLRTIYDSDGRKTLKQTNAALTNDRGEYRLFWVTPGRYSVSAALLNRPMPGVPLNPENVGNKYPRTFYPSTTNPSTASVLEIQPGAELRGIDIRLEEQPTFRVRGRVTDSTTGQIPPAGVAISIMSRDPILNSRIPSMGPAYNPADGTFELRDLSSGAFLIRAQLSLNRRQRGQSFQVPLSATAAVDVVGSDVEGVVLTLSPPVGLSGVAHLDGSGPAVSMRASVSLRPAGLSPAPRTAQLEADGTFMINDVSVGEYRVEVLEMFIAQYPNAYVKEIRFGSIDVRTQPVVISGPTSDKIEIIFAENGGKIDGIVRGNSAQMMSTMTVVLVPDEHERHDLYKVTATDASGRFTLRAIPPGSYRVYVWEEIERNSWFDPTVMHAYESVGTPVAIGQSSSVTLELKPIPVSRDR